MKKLGTSLIDNRANTSDPVLALSESVVNSYGMVRVMAVYIRSLE